MRFSFAAALGVVSLAVFAPSAVVACEHECQVNVSRAFADKYEYLSGEYFTLLSTKIENSLFYGVPDDTLTATEKNVAIQVVKNAVVGAQAAWDKTVFQTVFDTIFKDEPKFKGDCNHPHRVIQPPRGVNWTMPDCHNMDYICGNPPSICHFMPMIKTRIVKKLTGQLQISVDGDDSDVYVNFLGPSLQYIINDQPKLTPFVATLHGNLNQILETIKVELTSFAGESQWKHEWDLEIKILLLTFP
ncbi:hypothetical protein BGZ99_004911 [Dissophora globulifera]|uniref:Uncharacterized protein n=1 Tax=Dissophora globulifera TaxID=979702 RepID=A0A9P6RST7_9FUNG|nr:hypothetical protein BGZ99_004911 [Dissophora globulifera]